ELGATVGRHGDQEDPGRTRAVELDVDLEVVERGLTLLARRLYLDIPPGGQHGLSLHRVENHVEVAVTLRIVHLFLTGEVPVNDADTLEGDLLVDPSNQLAHGGVAPKYLGVDTGLLGQFTAVCCTVRFVVNERKATVRAELYHLRIPSEASTSLARTVPVGRVVFHLDRISHPVHLVGPLLSHRICTGGASAVHQDERNAVFIKQAQGLEDR